MKNGNNVALVEHTESGLLSKEDINTLAQAGVVPKGTPMAQIMVFAKICRERGLSPFSKEIYLVGYGSNYSVIVGIDGFRRLACETGQHAGTDDAKYDLKPNGEFVTAAQLKAANQLPTTCTVTVHRVVAGMKASFTHTAVFSEFNSGKQKWSTMPFQMIAKVAEAFALRKGFADRLSGLDIPEEQAAYENDIAPAAPAADMEELLDQIRSQIEQINSVADLTAYYRKNTQWHNDPEIIQLFTDRKNEIDGN